MADDPRVHGSLANPSGIAIDEAADTWWSGRVFDVVEIDNLMDEPCSGGSATMICKIRSRIQA